MPLTGKSLKKDEQDPPSGPSMAKPSGDPARRPSFKMTGPRMPLRLQSYFWRFLDQAMPDGPPVFLVLVIAFLLAANGFVAFSRW